VGRDYGTQMEVLTGLKDGEKVVANPTDDLQEGMEAKTREMPADGAKAAASPQGR
jgi:multidrug efflux pump subunit AcrA (membrane-fusion protein)